jgi:hypothetical protein
MRCSGVRWLAVVALVGLGLGGCGDVTGVPDYRYTLESVQGQAWALVGDDVVITGGSLDLHPDDAVVQHLSMTCAAGQSGCTPPEEWRARQGVLDRTAAMPQDWIRVEWIDGRQSRLRTAADTVWVGYPLPPHLGIAGEVMFRFQR